VPPNLCNVNPPVCNGTSPGPHRPAAAAFDTIARLRTTGARGPRRRRAGRWTVRRDAGRVRDASVHDRNLIIPIVIFSC